MTYLPLDHARGRAIPDSAIQTLWWTDTSIKAIGAIWSVKGVNDVSKRYVPWSEYDFPSIREWDYKSIFYGKSYSHYVWIPVMAYKGRQLVRHMETNIEST